MEAWPSPGRMRRPKKEAGLQRGPRSREEENMALNPPGADVWIPSSTTLFMSISDDSWDLNLITSKETDLLEFPRSQLVMSRWRLAKDLT